MIASTLSDVLKVKLPGADLPQRALASLNTLASSAASTVADGGERVTHLLWSMAEPVPRRALGAMAWVNGRVLDGFDYVGTSAAASLSFVDDEVRTIAQRTRDAVDRSVAAGLRTLGVPTQREFTDLRHRMDAISVTVERLKHEVERKAATRRAPRRATPR